MFISLLISILIEIYVLIAFNEQLQMCKLI